MSDDKKVFITGDVEEGILTDIPVPAEDKKDINTSENSEKEKDPRE